MRAEALVNSSNLILIGMPGSGKSTLGKRLANRLPLSFCDTDRLIEQQTGETLQETVDRCGYQHLRAVEEQVILTATFKSQVVATGGSVVYSDAAMRRLTQIGVVIYLNIGLKTLMSRIGEGGQRGLARPPQQTIEALYCERRPLYERYAMVTVECDHDSEEVLCERIAGLWEQGLLGGDSLN